MVSDRRCEACGARLPRSTDNRGRERAYCNAACKQRAYRARGGRASGTTGGQRYRATATGTRAHAGGTVTETRTDGRTTYVGHCDCGYQTIPGHSRDAAWFWLERHRCYVFGRSQG